MWMKTSTPLLTRERRSAVRPSVEYESEKLVHHGVQLVWLPALVRRLGQPTVQGFLHGGGQILDSVHADELPVPSAGQDLPRSAGAVGRYDWQAARKRLDHHTKGAFPPGGECDRHRAGGRGNGV